MIARRLRSLSSVCSRDRDNQLSSAQLSAMMEALSLSLTLLLYVWHLGIGRVFAFSLLPYPPCSKVSTVHVVQGYDVMCYLYLLLFTFTLLWTDYGDDGIM